MSDNQELVLRAEMGVAKSEEQPSVGVMLQTIISKGVTGESVAAVEKLVALYERMEDRNAERAFNAAFTKLQSELPVIVAKTEIPNRGKYERFEDVMEAIGKPLVANGFSVSFTQGVKDNRTVVTCTLRHVAGHKQSNDFAVRSGGRADSETQADCKAATTAKRNALLQALNIVIRQDCLNTEDDPRMEGGPVTPDQADELERRVKETNSNIAAFLKYAGGVKSFAEIPASAYERCDEMLRRKEGHGR